MKFPTIYLPHGGGPCFFMEWSPPDTWVRMGDWLRSLPASLPGEPRALVVISAHWEEKVPTVIQSAAPPLLYDYYGFPPETYQIHWPAPGSPELAARVQSLLWGAGIEARGNDERGFDHGVFIPLKVAWPEPKIPTVQLSLRVGLDPAEHLAIGRALAPLRDEGVLVLGSGMSYHNMRHFFDGGGLEASRRFDGWLGEAVTRTREARDSALAEWSQAPSARTAHPREEHLIPLLVTAGAAGDDLGRVVFRDEVMGAAVSAVQFG